MVEKVDCPWLARGGWGAILLLALFVSPAWAGEFQRPAKVRAVVLGGSISKYFKGNYGEFLQHGCKNLEVVNRAKVGLGGAALLGRLQDDILGDAALMEELQGAPEAWLFFQGGLNSVGSPAATSLHLSRIFGVAAGAGLRTMVLGLTPWGEEADRRFEGWQGMATVRATRKVNAYLSGHLTPDEALGKVGGDRPHAWMRGELPEIAVDLWEAGLRDADAPLRPLEPLAASFDASPYRKETARRAALIAEARAVPRHFLRPDLRDFDHVHPNTDGHRLMALATCRKAPASWGCDCRRIERARWKGKVVGP